MPAIRPPRLPVLPVRRTPPVRTVVDTGAPEPATITSRGVHWVHVTRPRRANQEWLEERYRFHPLDYEDVFSRNQRPKVDRYDDYIFVVLQFPRFDRERERLNVIEVDMFVGRDYVVTLADGELEPLDSLFARCQESEEVREGYFGKGAAFLLYKIVDHCVDASFPMLRKMGQKLERLEDDIFEGRSTEIVRDLSNAKQEIINFRRIVRPQRVALRDLERAMDLTTPEELDVYFDDVIDASERIWDTLENFKEVVAALEETNESVLSHRTNDVLRVLTAASVIFLPPTLIASIFGMNVQFPLEGTEIGFWVTMAVMASSLIGTIGYFRRRGWF